MTRLIYVMGASGVGKDSLLRELTRRRPTVLVAHRYITRASGRAENCVELSEAAFAWRREQGFFCLDWEAYGLRYGIGREIEQWLAAGHTVILNGSRRALAQARERFGDRLLPLLVVAEPPVLRQRLLARGRETPEEIERRLVRQCQEDELLGVSRIDNSGQLEDGVRALEAQLEPSWQRSMDGSA